MTSKRIISILKLVYPYILVIAAAFASNYFIFFNGVVDGDDIRFHLFQITDLLYGFEHGYFSLSTNHVFMGGFAIYNYGFYGPIPHYLAAIVAFIFKQDAIFGYKAVILLTSIMGGIFFYKLALKMSKNIHIATISSVFFIMMPYRIFCAACRCAFAEVAAICFIPLVFYGAYSILHDEKYNVGPYIALALGAAGVIMSHPFTGLMCAIFGVVYLACNFKLLFRKRNGFTIWPSIATTLILILCLTGFYVFNSLSTTNAGIYRLNDAVIDWTTYDHVADSTTLSNQFSGFLNFIVIDRWIDKPGWDVEHPAVIFMSIIILLVSIANELIADSLIKKAPKNKYYRWAVDAIALFVLPIVFTIRLEVILSCALFYIMHMFFSYFYETKDYQDSKGFNQIKNNPDLYFLIGSIFICFILMFVGGVWKVMPSIFYQAQFAWRLWGLTMFFISMLLTTFVSYLQHYKGAIVSFASLAAIMISLSQGLIEKRVDYLNGNRSVFKDVDSAYVQTEVIARYSGAQNEMVPLIMMDPTYEAEYGNSLYYKVSQAISKWGYEPYEFIYSLEDYEKYNPVFLEGEGDIKITKYNSPNNSFNVKIPVKSALIQFPQFYNKTYEIYSNGKYLATAKNVDGLIAFELPQGEYSIDLVFKNSKGYQIAKPFFYVGLAGIVPFALFGIYYHYKTESRKKEES